MTSTGDAFLLALLLGFAARSRLVGATTTAVAVALLARWGSSSLAAAAGAQAVLGPAFLLLPVPSMASTWLAAAALLLVAPVGWLAPLFGATAGLVAAGPGVTSPLDALVRLAALAAGAALAWFVAPRLALTWVPRLAPGLAVAAAALAVAA
ncbi:MAG TPA: hypothetical protein VM938_12945 [Acidimicrobiales bacterium]|nr:hypothetical protein [Acidimicrobiales bacterium]